MNIYMITQSFAPAQAGEEPLIELGKKLTIEGHRVFALTVGQYIDMDLGRKKIGLVSEEGLDYIAFNMPDYEKAGALKKLYIDYRFRKMAAKQGRLLPEPNLIVALSPPTGAALAAAEIKEHYGVPLVVLLKEFWPEALLERKEIPATLLPKLFGRLQDKIFDKADLLVTADREAAELLKNRGIAENKVKIASGSSVAAELFMLCSSLLT